MAPRCGRSTWSLFGMSKFLGGVLWSATLALCVASHVCSAEDASAAPALSCQSGPVKRTFGATSWDVYGCDDGHSVVVVTAAGNPATPFYFFFSWTAEGFDLRGEGPGNKRLTDAAFEDLKKLTDVDIAHLHQQAGAASK